MNKTNNEKRNIVDNIYLKTNIPFKKSILASEEGTKTLIEVRQFVTQEHWYCNVPESFDMVPVEIYKHLKKIDKLQQCGAISHDEAIEMIAQLFAGCKIRIRTRCR